jgi:hypothetical protein
MTNNNMDDVDLVFNNLLEVETVKGIRVRLASNNKSMDELYSTCVSLLGLVNNNSKGSISYAQ